MDAATQSQSTTLHSSFHYKLISFLGPDHVHAAAPADAVAGVQPKVIVAPGNERELAEVLRLSNEAGLSVIPRGGATKLGWGNPPSRADLVLSTARLNEITEHAWADLTVSVEAGCTIQKLQEALAQHGQRLALDPLWPDKATIGGVLSTNDNGALRLRFGALRDLIIGVTLALPDGTLARSGGKVVKNVAGYDLPKLVTGALGTLGVITRAVFRLHPVPHSSRTFSCLAHQLPEAQHLLLTIQDSKLAHTALQIRFIADAPHPRLDILFEGTEAGIMSQAAQLRSLVAPAPVTEADPSVWNARQELYSAAKRDESASAVAKFTTLPAEISGAIGTLASIAVTRIRCNAVVQATGIGHVLLQGEPAVITSVIQSFRAGLERKGNSLLVAHCPPSIQALDAWGDAGDALPLMKAVKQQLDPKSALNPGRFVGGI
jgi:glycolate oxidase FAD binding subunit